MKILPLASLCAALLSLGAGCGVSTREIAHQATAAAVNSTLHSLDNDENQRLILRILTAPETHAAARAFAADVVDASLDTLSEDARTERIQALSARYVAVLTRAATRGIADGMRRDLSPVMADIVRVSVDSAMREALNETHQRDLERLTAGITRATMEAASRGMADSLARDLPPALHTALTDPRTTQSIGAASHMMAREVVLGGNEALTQIQQAQERNGRPSLLSNLTNLSHKGVQIAQWVAIGAVLVALALGAWLVRIGARSRKISQENERNATTALMLAEAIRAAEGKPWAGELTELLRGRLRDADVNDVLDTALSHRKTRPAPPPRHSLPPRPSMQGA